MTPTPAFLSLLFTSATASAQITYLPSHIQNLEAPSTRSVNTSRMYDSETESDYLTYSFLPGRLEFVSQSYEDFFTGAAGSLGAKRFSIDNYLHLQTEIAEAANFRLQWIQEQNFTMDDSGVLLEFLFPIGKHAIGVHGSTDTLKANDDLGASYNFRSGNYAARLEATATDFTRNKRNEDTDYFSQKPYSYSLSVLRYRANGLEYIKMYSEPRFRWVFPGDSSAYKSEGSGVSVLSLNEWANVWIDIRQQEKHLNAEFEKYRSEKVQLWKSLQSERFGLRLVHKNWKLENGEVTHLDALPFYWKTISRSLDFGYEVTIHNAEGAAAVRSDLDADNAIEHRLNIAWKLTTSNKGRFVVFFTFDLDDLQGNAWEGGSGNLVLNF